LRHPRYVMSLRHYRNLPLQAGVFDPMRMAVVVARLPKHQPEIVQAIFRRPVQWCCAEGCEGRECWKSSLLEIHHKWWGGLALNLCTVAAVGGPCPPQSSTGAGPNHSGAAPRVWSKKRHRKGPAQRVWHIEQYLDVTEVLACTRRPAPQREPRVHRSGTSLLNRNVV
jgi:hypothetical protein